jgi:hypothetical protein
MKFGHALKSGNGNDGNEKKTLNFKRKTENEKKGQSKN